MPSLALSAPNAWEIDVVVEPTPVEDLLPTTLVDILASHELMVRPTGSVLRQDPHLENGQEIIDWCDEVKYT